MYIDTCEYIIAERQAPKARKENRTMLLAKNEHFIVEWQLVNATRIQYDGKFSNLEKAREYMEHIKRSYPVAFACISKAKN